MREGLEKVVPTEDTIVAISTPFGRGALGVVRLSGSRSESIAARFLKSQTPLAHRQAIACVWVEADGSATDEIDEVVATLFRSPHSYTGEDMLEISAHGNPLILRRIVETARGAGARIARPGEFTLRAVLNGKMDLIQAEAVRNFIDAQTDAQARTALLQIRGSLSKRIHPAQERLVDIIAQLEAGIDFADDDVASPTGVAIAGEMVRTRDELAELQRSYSFGKLLATGLQLAIVGKPNVGKSSLFNRFVGSDRAIVTDVPGTTRDILSETISLDGVPLRFLDTAGLRETSDPVEKIGVARTEQSFADADLVLIVVDGAAGVDEQDRNIISRIDPAPHIVVVNKCDLLRAGDGIFSGSFEAIRVSAKTGEGMEALKDAIRKFLGSREGDSAGDILTSARQFEAVSGAIRALEKGYGAIVEGTPHEMVLLDMYEALSDLSELTGEVVTEDILGRIFSTFCVGK